MKGLKNILNILTIKEVYEIIIIVIIGLIIYNLASIIFEKIIIAGKTEFERKKRKTIVSLFQNIFKYIVIICIVLFSLQLYGYNIKALVAGLGIVATVLGLALQDTIKDFISGITIIIENYYVTGDIVKYNDFVGEVIELSLKSTKIKSFSGEVLILANRNINEIVNLSQKEANILINIPIPYEADIDKVENMIIKDIIPKCQELKEVIKDKVLYLGIDELQDSSIYYLISVRCKQEKRWQVKREVLKIILKEMSKKKLSVPYNKIEVINAKD